MRFPFQISAAKEFDVTGFGENSLDYLIAAPHYPGFNTKLRFTEHTQAAGGHIASALVGLQRLSLRTAYAGCFGADAAGRFGIESLASEKVDTRFVEIIDGARSQTAFIIIDEGNGEHTVLCNRDERLIYRTG